MELGVAGRDMVDEDEVEEREGGDGLVSSLQVHGSDILVQREKNGRKEGRKKGRKEGRKKERKEVAVDFNQGFASVIKVTVEAIVREGGSGSEGGGGSEGRGGGSEGEWQ